MGNYVTHFLKEQYMNLYISTFFQLLPVILAGIVIVKYVQNPRPIENLFHTLLVVLTAVLMIICQTGEFQAHLNKINDPTVDVLWIVFNIVSMTTLILIGVKK